MNINEEIEQRLQTLSTEKIKDYNKKIIPSAYPFVGVPIPAIRKLAKEYAERAAERFDSFAPRSFEGVLLKGFLLGYDKSDFEALWKRTLSYLELCDNWAHIDCFFSGFRGCKTYCDDFAAAFGQFVRSDKVFFRRAVAVFNMDYRFDCNHIDSALVTLGSIKQGDYYCDMAVAWALSVAFCKNFDKTYDFMKNNVFSPDIKKMTAGKCRDSFRLSSEQKRKVKELLILKAREKI